MKNTIEGLIRKLLVRVKGKDVQVSPSVSTRDLILFVYHKGFWSLLRGVLHGIFINKKSRLIFIGKKANIQHRHMLFLDRGCYIGDYSYLNCLSTGGVHLGRNVTIREFGWVQLTSELHNPGDTLIIGQRTYIGPYSRIGAGGRVIIGEYCQLGTGVSIVAENHRFASDLRIYDQPVTREGVVIGNDCWIGNNVTILDGVAIGDGCVIGAGSLVNKSLPPNTVAAGVPAKVIRLRS